MARFSNPKIQPVNQPSHETRFLSPSHRQGIWASVDFGTPGGNTMTTRFDNSITEPAVSASYVGGNLGHFLNSGGTRDNSSGIPNNTGIGDAATLSAVHNSLHELQEQACRRGFTDRRARWRL